MSQENCSPEKQFKPSDDLDPNHVRPSMARQQRTSTLKTIDFNLGNFGNEEYRQSKPVSFANKLLLQELKPDGTTQHITESFKNLSDDQIESMNLQNSDELQPPIIQNEKRKKSFKNLRHYNMRNDNDCATVCNTSFNRVNAKRKYDAIKQDKDLDTLFCDDMELTGVNVSNHNSEIIDSTGKEKTDFASIPSVLNKENENTNMSTLANFIKLKNKGSSILLCDDDKELTKLDQTHVLSSASMELTSMSDFEPTSTTLISNTLSNMELTDLDTTRQNEMNINRNNNKMYELLADRTIISTYFRNEDMELTDVNLSKDIDVSNQQMGKTNNASLSSSMNTSSNILSQQESGLVKIPTKNAQLYNITSNPNMATDKIEIANLARSSSFSISRHLSSNLWALKKDKLYSILNFKNSIENEKLSAPQLNRYNLKSTNNFINHTMPINISSNMVENSKIQKPQEVIDQAPEILKEQGNSNEPLVTQASKSVEEKEIVDQQKIVTELEIVSKPEAIDESIMEMKGELQDTIADEEKHKQVNEKCELNKIEEKLITETRAPMFSSVRLELPSLNGEDTDFNSMPSVINAIGPVNSSIVVGSKGSHEKTDDRDKSYEFKSTFVVQPKKNADCEIDNSDEPLMSQQSKLVKEQEIVNKTEIIVPDRSEPDQTVDILMNDIIENVSTQEQSFPHIKSTDFSQLNFLKMNLGSLIEPKNSNFAVEHVNRTFPVDTKEINLKSQSVDESVENSKNTATVAENNLMQVDSENPMAQRSDGNLSIFGNLFKIEKELNQDSMNDSVLKFQTQTDFHSENTQSNNNTSSMKSLLFQNNITKQNLSQRIDNEVIISRIKDNLTNHKKSELQEQVEKAKKMMMLEQSFFTDFVQDVIMSEGDEKMKNFFVRQNRNVINLRAFNGHIALMLDLENPNENEYSNILDMRLVFDFEKCKLKFWSDKFYLFYTSKSEHKNFIEILKLILTKQFDNVKIDLLFDYGSTEFLAKIEQDIETMLNRVSAFTRDIKITTLKFINFEFKAKQDDTFDFIVHLFGINNRFSVILNISFDNLSIRPRFNCRLEEKNLYPFQDLKKLIVVELDREHSLRIDKTIASVNSFLRSLRSRYLDQTVRIAIFNWNKTD